MMFSILLDQTKCFIRDERGVTAIEYAIIGVAISALVLALFAGGGDLETALTNAISLISGNINSAN
ncbi:Flp family type IVb pilin [Grimontia hollisae]|uniref:Flp family type IVb pilin n=2 Tax=Grimontia hollisae TaxID=673 RepID=D0I9B6_GRIHO|nr:hypothetical protein VHA_002453 [Grimontia hollisae CIP 101886]STO77559.1 Flp pilus assembly protein, pilin Flp [Grimontia hollisae]STO98538.1 Flp pilus assembly protein, pilin Flp [Grimontia hollisae]STQ75635.1 Flp pilus assembly protein, pilin Flp [Grimontia hollisae]